MATSLERALNTVQGKKQSRKLGRYEVDTVHRIQVLNAFLCCTSVSFSCSRSLFPHNCVFV